MGPAPIRRNKSSLSDTTEEYDMGLVANSL